MLCKPHEVCDYAMKEGQCPQKTRQYHDAWYCVTEVGDVTINPSGSLIQVFHIRGRCFNIHQYSVFKNNVVAKHHLP